MINPKFEIERLRRTLIWKGLDDREATEVSNLAADDIAQAISDLALNAMAEAIQFGERLGIENWSQQITIINTGDSISIGTDTGKTDFSWPSINMLPHLLKNAKTAKDGSRYKIIPIGKSSRTKTSSADVAIDLQQAQTVARDALKNNKIRTSNGDPLQSSALFSGLAQAKQFMTNRKKMQHVPQANNPTQEFRTATSKQNPATQWVIPPKDRDMTVILADINRALETNILNTINSIVSQYEELA